MLLTSAQAPGGTANLAIERCEYTGFGESCHEQMRKHACAIGGNVVYGVHWESGYRTSYVVGTIGVSASLPAPESGPEGVAEALEPGTVAP